MRNGNKLDKALTFILTSITIISILFITACMLAPPRASGSELVERVSFTKVEDLAMKYSQATEKARHEHEKARAREVIDALAAFREAEAEPEPELELEPMEPDECYEDVYDDVYYEPAYYAPASDYHPTDGLTKEGGINYHDGRTETYYSSSVLYHSRTSEWTVDSEGFYRTDEGQYVVAASDMPQGTTFEGSKGECIVLDTGCPPGITDYYVAF